MHSTCAVLLLKVPNQIGEKDQKLWQYSTVLQLLRKKSPFVDITKFWILKEKNLKKTIEIHRYAPFDKIRSSRIVLHFKYIDMVW